MYNAKYLQPQVSTKGLFAHYKMWDGLMATGKIFDYTSTGKGGTLVDTDTPKTLVPTYPGFNFTPTNDYISIDDHNDFTPAGTPFSISVWVKMHDATNFMIATKGEFGTDGEWVLFTNGNDELVFNMFDEDAGACIGQKSNTSLTSYENIWIHIVVTSDGGTANSGIKLLVNGIRVDDTDDGGGSFVAVENLGSTVDIGRYAI